MVVGIPEVIHDFNMYLSGSKLAGITGEVTIPPLESITATISGPGILGEYDTPVPGHFGNIAQEVPFRCINEDYFKMVDTSKPLELTLRGSIQHTVAATQALDEVGMRVVFRGHPTTVDIGKVAQRNTMDSKIAMNLTYILIEMDGKPRIELDKLAGVYKINGVDQLAKVRRNT